MSDGMDYQTKLLEEVRTDVRAIRRVLYGNGLPGVITRLDRLEEWRKSASRFGATWRERAWNIGTTIVIALITAVATLLGYGGLT